MNRLLLPALQRGFTFIELLIFVIVSSLLMSTIIIGVNAALTTTPANEAQWVALQTARGCLEWLLGQKRLNGYSSITCPSTPSAASCPTPSGYTTSISVTCSTWNSDSTYKTFTVSITGLARATLSVQVGDF